MPEASMFPGSRSIDLRNASQAWSQSARAATGSVSSSNLARRAHATPRVFHRWLGCSSRGICRGRAIASWR